MNYKVLTTMVALTLIASTKQ